MESLALKQRSPKLGERIAMQIADKVAADKLPVGAPVGTEGELLSQYRSSRCTMREAIAILERDGVVSVRRGRGGGLFVAPTDMDGLRHAIRAYFEYLGIGYDEIFLARKVLSMLALRLASERMEQEDVKNLRIPGIRFWAILKATHNPVLDILGKSAGRYELLSLIKSEIRPNEYFDFLARTLRLLGKQAEVLIGGNLHVALDLNEQIIELGEAFVNKMLASQRRLAYTEVFDQMELFVGPRRPIKKPELVTYSLLNDISNCGWEVGYHLGSEPELITRFGVGRSVFREAVRPMEQYGIVEMRTGKLSGLKVSAPTFERINSEFGRRFKMLDLPSSSYAETYDAIGAASVALAATRNKSTKNLDSRSPCELNDILASGGGNRILAAMHGILSTIVGVADEGAGGAATVIEAVKACDPALAYRSFMLLRTTERGGQQSEAPC